MKSVNQLIYALLISAGLLAVNSACKHPAPPPPVPLVTTVTGISPATAPVGSTVVITGTNFSTTPTSNTVTIGGVVVTVVSATDTQLVVIVPPNGVSGVVSVTANGTTGQSNGTFTVSVKPTKEIQGEIRRNATWRKDTTYILRGLVYVPTDYTLTIEPGTVIKGAPRELDPTSKNLTGTLVVERGGKLVAVGTAAQPIVFTSSKAAGQRSYGDWGGIVLIGKAPQNQPGSTPYDGGIRGTVETYNEPADNSGTLQYVRIEFAGAAQPIAGSRLNGLTMYGVGYGTTIDHVQVSYSGTDSFAWFGGGANMKYVVSLRAYDDDWSADRGYTNKQYSNNNNNVQPGAGGKVQFGVSLRDPSVADPAGANSIESQNFNPGENAAGVPLTQSNGLPQTAPVFANISSFAFNTTPDTKTVKAGMYLKGNTAISVYNSVFVGYPEGLRLEGTATGTYANALANELDLRGIVLANTLTPVVGGGAITNDQAQNYFTPATGANRSNQIVASSDLMSLMLNSATFSLTAPNFVPIAGSPLLQGAVTTGKVADTQKFFTPTTYRGAFGTENWVQGWTQFDPQSADYGK